MYGFVVSIELVEEGGFTLLYSKSDLLVLGEVYILIFSSRSGFIAKFEFVFSEENELLSVLWKLWFLEWLEEFWSSRWSGIC